MKDQDMFAYATWMEKFGGFAKDMTLRDHFAGLAMQGDMASAIATNEFAWCADRAYKLADAMLKARGQ